MSKMNPYRYFTPVSLPSDISDFTEVNAVATSTTPVSNDVDTFERESDSFAVVSATTPSTADSNEVESVEGEGASSEVASTTTPSTAGSNEVGSVEGEGASSEADSTTTPSTADSNEVGTVEGEGASSEVASTTTPSTPNSNEVETVEGEGTSSEVASTTTPSTPNSNEVETVEGGDSNAVVEVSNDGVQSAIKKHVNFFDRNYDGVITVGETQDGLVALGIGGARAWAMATVINSKLGSLTGASWLSPWTIHIDQIPKFEDPRNTDLYTEEGEFSFAKFNVLFVEYDLDGDNALSEAELINFRNRNLNREGEEGLVASSTEIDTFIDFIMEIAGEERGTEEEPKRVITAETLASFFDGSFFYRVAGEPIPA